MRDRLDGIAVFVTAVEAGGFARAAERLALSRSAVAKTIARLEERLSVRLFHRTTRSQSLTEDGQIYYAHCSRALEQLRQGETLLVARRREISGKFTVAMPVLFGRRHVEPLLLRFAREHPALELDLRLSDTHVDLAADGVDLAIRLTSPGTAGGNGARRLATQEKVLCAAPSYISRHEAPQEIGDLQHHELLVFRLNGQPLAWPLLDRDQRLVYPTLKSRFQFDHYESMVDAAIQGMGIAHLPRWIVLSASPAGCLEPLLADHPPARQDIFAVWPGRHPMSTTLRNVIDLLAEKIPTLVNP